MAAFFARSSDFKAVPFDSETIGACYLLDKLLRKYHNGLHPTAPAAY
jgi:hypothetical protein